MTSVPSPSPFLASDLFGRRHFAPRIFVTGIREKKSSGFFFGQFSILSSVSTFVCGFFFSRGIDSSLFTRENLLFFAVSKKELSPFGKRGGAAKIGEKYISAALSRGPLPFSPTNVIVYDFCASSPLSSPLESILLRGKYPQHFSSFGNFWHASLNACELLLLFMKKAQAAKRKCGGKPSMLDGFFCMRWEGTRLLLPPCHFPKPGGTTSKTGGAS